MARKVLELRGYKSLKALNAFNALLLGMKMLPAHMTESYESFFESFKEKSDAEKETILREAAVFVALEKDEVESLVCFCTDKNGIPYTASNIDNLSPDDLHEIIVSVCLEIGKIKITLVSDSEKKK